MALLYAGASKFHMRFLRTVLFSSSFSLYILCYLFFDEDKYFAVDPQIHGASTCLHEISV